MSIYSTTTVRQTSIASVPSAVRGTAPQCTAGIQMSPPGDVGLQPVECVASFFPSREADEIAT